MKIELILMDNKLILKINRLSEKDGSSKPFNGISID